MLVTSCATSVDGSWVSGRVHDVTPQDVRAAVAASRAVREATFREGGVYSWTYVGQRPRQIDIISADEIHIYWDDLKAVYPGHVIVKRIHGKWRYDSEIIVTS